MSHDRVGDDPIARRSPDFGPARDERNVAFAIARGAPLREQKESSGCPPRRDRVPR
jgi:hypothetical protein